VWSCGHLIGLCHLLQVWWKPQEGCKLSQVPKGFSCYGKIGLRRVTRAKVWRQSSCSYLAFCSRSLSGVLSLHSMSPFPSAGPPKQSGPLPAPHWLSFLLCQKAEQCKCSLQLHYSLQTVTFFICLPGNLGWGTDFKARNQASRTQAFLVGLS